MASLSTYAADGLNDLTLNGDSFTSPAAVYLGWFTTPPSPDGGTQAAGGRGAIEFLAPSAGGITSDAEVEWPSFHTADQMLAGWGLWDASVSGNLLMFGRTRAALIRANTPLSVPAGGLVIDSLDDHITDYLANAYLNHLLRNTAYTSPSSLVLGQFTETPTATDPGVEVAGGDYTPRPAAWSASSERKSALSGEVTWAPLHTSDQTLTGWALSDDDANILRFADYPEPITVPGGDPISFASGSITLRLS